MAKTLSDIESELAAARADLSKRQAELEAAERTVADINAEYDAQSARAINHGDSAARQWLSQADQALFSAQATVRQTAAAAKELLTLIETLEAEKIATYRRDIERQISETESAMLADCVALDDGVARLILARDAVYAKREKLMALAQQIGNDIAKYNKIEPHMSRTVMWQVFPRQSNWMKKEDRDAFAQPFSKLMESLLHTDENWQDVTEKILSTDAEREAS